MDFYSISDGKGGKYHLGVVGDFEFVDPLTKLAEDYITQRVQFLKTVTDAHFKADGGNPFPEHVWIKTLIKNAVESWQELQKEYLEAKTPQSLWNCLSASSKKDQIKALRNLSITWNNFHAFVCQAGEKLRYKYSFYRAEFHRKGLDKTRLPRLIRLRRNAKVDTVGKTDLTDGQLKQVITDRKVILAKFLDKGDEWHCFFYTYKSIAGEENYQGEQPHIHYISSKWGISRADVVAAIKSGTYRATPVHIKIDKIKKDSDEDDE